MQTGKYKHYKGNYYEVLGVAMHSESHEKMVVYRALYDCPELKAEYGDHPLFVRPYTMFNEMIDLGEQQVRRFAFVSQ